MLPWWWWAEIGHPWVKCRISCIFMHDFDSSFGCAACRSILGTSIFHPHGRPYGLELAHGHRGRHDPGRRRSAVFMYRAERPIGVGWLVTAGW